jgi:hypothetical protein
VGGQKADAASFCLPRQVWNDVQNCYSRLFILGIPRPHAGSSQESEESSSLMSLMGSNCRAHRPQCICVRSEIFAQSLCPKQAGRAKNFTGD